MSEIIEKVREAREASYLLAKLSTDAKDQALKKIADSISQHEEELVESNRKDVETAEVMLRSGEITGAMMKRLELNKEKIQRIADMVRSVASLDDPIGKTEYSIELDRGLTLFRVTSPIGVIAVIFESRPDALPQIASLCLKSGNSILLKGGSEAHYSNQQLFSIIKDADVSLPEGWIQLIEARREVDELLKLDGYIDLIIPRGGNDFVRYIQNNTRIPVLGHTDGVCHIYVDNEADVDMAVDVCYDAKVQYPSVCNAVDTILIHKEIIDRFLPRMVDRYMQKNVEVRGCSRVLGSVKGGVSEATDEDWGAEYLDYIVSMKIVDDIDEAINHINTFGSHHTDAIITSKEENAHRFMASLDSANVFWNASTRFSDGYRYGLGSEVGISTGKIHVRGPTGLEGLTIYKYYLEGNGHIVADYEDNKSKKFTHKPIDEKWRRQH